MTQRIRWWQFVNITAVLGVTRLAVRYAVIRDLQIFPKITWMNNGWVVYIERKWFLCSDFRLNWSLIRSPSLWIGICMVCCKVIAPFHLILRAREDVCLYYAEIWQYIYHVLWIMSLDTVQAHCLLTYTLMTAPICCYVVCWAWVYWVFTNYAYMWSCMWNDLILWFTYLLISLQYKIWAWLKKNTKWFPY